jgi:class 3 adenylate cyclase
MNPIKEVDIESVSASDGMSLGSKFDYDDDDDDHTSRSPMDSSGHDGQTMNSSGYLAAEYTPRQRQLAAKEIQTVRRIKLFVVTSLLVLTTSVALGAYFLSANQEFWDFEAQYQEDATKLLQTVGKNLVLTLSAADAFTVSITSLAATTNQSWPFVVVPDFAVRAEKIRTLANAILVNTYPIVAPEERAEWEDFTARTGKAQVDESIAAIADYDGIDYWPIVTNYTLFNVLHDYSEYDKPEAEQGRVGTDLPGPWMPMWQTQPTIAYDAPYNWDLTSVPNTATMSTSSMDVVRTTHRAVLTEAYLISYPDDEERLAEDMIEAEWIASYLPPGEEPMEPISDIFYPIIANANENIEVHTTTAAHTDETDDEVVGIFSVSVYWRDMIKNILPQGSNGLMAVFENPCNPSFTYEINGPNANFLGAGDHHDPKYTEFGLSVAMSDFAIYAEDTSYSGVPLDDEFCPFTLSIYPSSTTEDRHTTRTPIYFSLVTVVIFSITALTFVLYDFWVERRQKVVMKTAVTTTKLVSELFPDAVIDQMMDSDHQRSSTSTSLSTDGQPNRVKTFLNDGSNNDMMNDTESGRISKTGAKYASKPIAELFPDTTVFFADIAGFTAWSSVREPAAVFTLLETLYGEFDKMAKKFGIFKVETIGDSYVAVCGLPEPNRNHAVAMSRFAFECLRVMKMKARELEMTLGPGTADLSLRIGMHSGPTIAGVLRGEKARFQLFGDTVNTAARMESNGTPNKIQVSQKTADLIIKSGKEGWLTARSDLINAKGKGQLQTYWLSRKSASRRSSTHSSITSLSSDGNATSGDLRIDPSPTKELDDHTPAGTDSSFQRLVDWNVTIFEELLEEIVAHRGIMTTVSSASSSPNATALIESVSPKGTHVRDEVVETITMPAYNAASTNQSYRGGDGSAKLNPKAVSQLRDYVTKIASYYHADNGFHNFQHASHVIMSTVKLLQRIATPDVKKRDCETDKDYFNYTFGISHDPLTKFAIVFSALIHDVDHQGVSNFQLAKEKDSMAIAYENKSVLEQHSFDLAWSLLTESKYKDLRNAIYSTQEEYDRFRQLSVNCVLATDIFDKDMKSFRDSRWEKAFKSDSSGDNNNNAITRIDDNEDWNRKATITIECIIQASDVAHTMQHWHVYQRWNLCLFKEMHQAFMEGRSDKDPALGWYDGELWFFDNYIIPLAKKLRECEVFGVSCDEFLDFATENRKEWSVKGRDIVAQMLLDVTSKNETKKIATDDDDNNL